MVTEATVSTTEIPFFCRQHTDTAGTAAIETGVSTVDTYPTAAADASSAASGGIIEARTSPPRQFKSQEIIDSYFDLEDVLPRDG